MAALLAQTGVICSATISLVDGNAQNIWTQRVLPVSGNAVITGFVARDLVGITTSSQFLTLFCAVEGVPCSLLYFMPNAAGGPGYSQSTPITPAGVALLPNPRVTAQIVSLINETPASLTIDVIGYFI